jgi:hypothetical protein
LGHFESAAVEYWIAVESNSNFTAWFFKGEEL